MRWTPGSGSNVEDARGRSAGGFGIPMGIGGVLVLLVGSWLTGVNLFLQLRDQPLGLISAPLD